MATITVKFTKVIQSFSILILLGWLSFHKIESSSFNVSSIKKSLKSVVIVMFFYETLEIMNFHTVELPMITRKNNLHVWVVMESSKLVIHSGEFFNEKKHKCFATQKKLNQVAVSTYPTRS